MGFVFNLLWAGRLTGGSFRLTYRKPSAAIEQNPSKSSHQSRFSGNVGKAKKVKTRKPVSLERHRRFCTICAHEKCAEIEKAFVAWESPASIAAEYGLADRQNIYRHAHALGLMAKRKRNLHAALSKIIEKAGEVEVNASAVVAAVQAYAKINALGQCIDRSETVNLNELFERMTRDELEAHAKDGTLPAWFTETVGVARVVACVTTCGTFAEKMKSGGVRSYQFVTVDKFRVP